MYRSVGFAVWAILVTPMLVFAADWTQFRGPQGDGHAAAKGLVSQWSETSNILWKGAVPGKGWSSPVFANGIIWVTSAETSNLMGEELDKAKEKLSKNPLAKEMEVVGSISLSAVGIDAATGEVKAKVPLFKIEQPDPVHSLNSYASPSPILDGEQLYCHFGTWGTACVNTKTSKIVWKTNLPTKHSVGPGSSPCLCGKVLVIPCDGIDAQFVIGLDTATGKEVWKTQRPPMAGSEVETHKAFSTPLLIEHEGKQQVVVPGAQWVVAYEPSTGKSLWQVNYAPGFSNVPRPVFSNGIVYVCTGYMVPELWAIRVDGKGDVTASHVAWKIKQQVPAMSSPIVVGEEVYFVSDNGIVTCVNAATGEQYWKKRIGGNFSASPMLADGKLFFCSREGETTLLKPGKTFEEIGRNTLEGQLMATPAIVDGTLLLRTQSHLYRLGVRP